jgi:signal transduction histidine kinase
MPEEIRQRVFDPFFTTKQVGKGTGQGLSFAYACIVDRHGGSISVASEPGVGTMFEISLPLTEQAEGSAADAAA